MDPAASGVVAKCQLTQPTYHTTASLLPQELLAVSADLEQQLMTLNLEKAQLTAEMARMPAHAGRNRAERQRKEYIEQRLDELNKQIAGLRLRLKRLGL